MSPEDMIEFFHFCQQATDSQVESIYLRETEANREDFAAIAMFELENRGIPVPARGAKR
jgi:hypothetical protein